MYILSAKKIKHLKSDNLLVFDNLLVINPYENLQSGTSIPVNNKICSSRYILKEFYVCNNSWLKVLESYTMLSNLSSKWMN